MKCGWGINAVTEAGSTGGVDACEGSRALSDCASAGEACEHTASHNASVNTEDLPDIFKPPHVILITSEGDGASTVAELVVTVRDGLIIFSFLGFLVTQPPHLKFRFSILVGVLGRQFNEKKTRINSLADRRKEENEGHLPIPPQSCE
jgi:hypothetical protein